MLEMSLGYPYFSFRYDELPDRAKLKALCPDEPDEVIDEGMEIIGRFRRDVEWDFPTPQERLRRKIARTRSRIWCKLHPKACREAKEREMELVKEYGFAMIEAMTKAGPDPLVEWLWGRKSDATETD